MSQDLTFAQVNAILPSPIFSVDTGNIILNVNTLTGDTVSDLTNFGIVETCFKLLTACYRAQVEANKVPDFDLTSFTPPFYGTVQNNTPPTIEGSITVTGVIPLDVDNLNGR